MRSNDMRIIYRKVCHMILMLLYAASLFSCVKVELCTEEEHPHTGGVRIIYHWPDDVKPEGVDSMLVLANRIINTRRVGYVTDAVSSVGGRYRFGETKKRHEFPFAVSAGEYQIFAFNNDLVREGEAPAYRLDSLEAYSDEQKYSSVGIRDLSISYVGRQLKDPSLDRFNKDWEDLNPYALYIPTEVPAIYRALNQHNEATQEYTVSIRADEEKEVHLYPRRITQNITFSFPIYTDEKVVIDSIRAEISGIPGKMNLYSGAIVTDTTYKMLFGIDVDENITQKAIIQIKEGDSSVDKVFTQLECMGTVSVMGLISNKDPNYRTGAGILLLCIYAHTTNDEGEIKIKTQYAKINLYNTIRRANLLIRNELGEIVHNPGIYDGRERRDTLRIDDSRLILTRELILETSDTDVSVDTWMKTEDGNFDIDI